MPDRPPLPPFTRETAAQKVQAAEDAGTRGTPSAWRSPTPTTSVWRNRDQFVTGRTEIVAFLTQKWERELEYALRKSLWTFEGDRIAVRFQYESHDRDGQWWRSYGNELWEFDRARPDVAPRGEHQRPRDRRVRAAHLRTASGGGARGGNPAAMSREARTI